MKLMPALEKSKRKLIRWLLLFVLVSLTLIYINQWIGARTIKLDEKLLYQRSEIAKYKKIDREVREIKKRLGTDEKKWNIYDTLAENRESTTKKLLSVFNASSDAKVDITKLVQDSGGIIIDGQAADDMTLAKYIKTLETLEWIGSAKLSSSPALDADMVARIEFRIALREKKAPPKYKKIIKKRVKKM